MITEYFDVGTMPTEYCDQHFYDSDDYDYNYDTDSSDQTDNTTDTDNSENSDNGDTDNSGDSNNTDDNGNSGDDGTDNTGGSDDNGDGNEDDSLIRSTIIAKNYRTGAPPNDIPVLQKNPQSCQLRTVDFYIFSKLILRYYTSLNYTRRSVNTCIISESCKNDRCFVL